VVGRGVHGMVCNWVGEWVLCVCHPLRGQTLDFAGLFLFGCWNLFHFTETDVIGVALA